MGLAPRRLLALVALLGLTGACAYTPVSASLAPPPLAESTRIYAADGTLITQLIAEENRENVTLDELPQHLLDAVIAIEDARFWKHKGVDVKAILRAAVTNASEGEVVEGGSTITQQYVKTALLNDERDIDRKIEEALLAVQLERRYTKERILELYLNTIYFGAGAYGVQAASQTYFGVPAADITLAQAATLAGLIRAPEATEPFANPEAALARRNLVLKRMEELGLVEHGPAAWASASPLGIAEARPHQRYVAGHFVEQVKRFVLDDPRFGATAADRRALLFGGGLRITTTLDLRQQVLAEAAVGAVRPAPPGPDAALIALEPATGYVRALVGGRDFFGNDPRAKLDLATGGVGRHAGSSFKPLVLAAALEEGISLKRTYPAPSRTVIELPDRPDDPWEVSNYEGGGGGTADLREATVRSYNTVYARLIMDVGPEKAVELAARMGIDSPLQPYPSAVLGTNDVHPIDMASAYATLANRGLHVDPVFVTKITRRDGTVLHQHQPDPQRAVRAEVADAVTAVLQQAVERGTGTRARLPGRPVAGKTGTSQQWRDAWFVGFTPQLVTAVWMGFAEAAKISMAPPATPIRVTGGSWPAEIWRRFMEPALEGQPVVPFPDPPPDIDDDPVAELQEAARRAPSVRGLPFEAALARLEQAGFGVRRVDEPNAEFPPGIVFAQSPVRDGSVTLRVAAPSPDAVQVPSVIGQDEATAATALIDAGFVVRVIDEAGGAAPGQVWRQDPGEGTTVTRGRMILLWVEPR